MAYDGTTPETRAHRIRRLQAEAKQLAREDVMGLARDLREIGLRAQEIVAGGDAYAVGIRELASRMVERLDFEADTIVAIQERVK